jgi:hypothetical protein
VHVCFLFACMFIARNLTGKFGHLPREVFVVQEGKSDWNGGDSTFVATEGMSVEDHGTRFLQS